MKSSLVESKTIDRLSLSVPIFFLLMALWLVIFPVRDYDTFWHLANGQAMLDQGRIINEEIFSYSAFGKEFVNHSWLAQIILALCYQLGGINALIVYKVVLTGALFFFSFKTCRFLGVSRSLSASAAFIVVLAGLSRFVVRPQLFAYLGLGVVFWLTTGYLKDRLSRKILYLLPPLFVIWDFMHGSSIFGTIFCGALCCGETVKLLGGKRLGQWQSPYKPTREKVIQISLWFAIALITTLAKPNGLALFLGVFSIIGPDNFIFSITGEFLPTTWEAAFIPFWVLLGFTVAAMLINWRRVDVTQLFLLLPFVYLGLRYNRGVAVCAIVIAPLCVCSLQQLFQRPGLQSKAIKLCFLLAMAAALCWTVYIKLPEKGAHLDPSGVRTGMGINRAFLPIGVTEFIKTANLQGNMFNTDRFGGLLAFYLYPERRIFHYNHPLLFRDIYEYLHNPGARDKWEHSYAIVAKPLEVKMFDNKGWVRVYHDPSVMVLVDPRQTDKRIIEKYAIRYFNPLMSFDQAKKYSRTPQFARGFLREVANYLQFNEDPRFCLILVEGVSGDHVGLDEQDKISLLSAALDSNPKDDALLNNLGLLLLRQGNAAAAKGYLERAQQVNFSRTGALNLGFVYLELRSFERAAEVFDQLLKKDANDADAIFGLAMTLRGQNRHQQALGLFEHYLQLAPQGRFAQRARGFIAEK